MNKTIVFGHKNPDTDSICSALVYADLKRALGIDAEAVRLGNVNKETEFVLASAKVEAPKLIDKAEQGQDVILVDHNEFQQSLDNIRDVKIKEVIDHHRVANFETSDPLYFRVEPVGCTATILLKIFKENNVEVSQSNALLLLSAIVSDTLLFKSPTCTEQDVQAAKELGEIAEVDVDEYGLEMLKAGTNLSDKTIIELLEMDAKEFTMGDSKVEIAQINAIDIDAIYAQQVEFETEINKIIEAKGLDLFLLVVTDILNSNSDVLAIGPRSENVEDAFKVQLAANRALLKGVVSRKKQIVTKLESTFL